MRTPGFYIFILIAFAIYFVVHLYIFISLRTGLSTSRTASFYLAMALLVFALLYPLSRFLGRIDVLTYLGSVWLGVAAISFSIFLLKDIVSIFLPANKGQITYTALILVLLISVYSFINEKKLRIKEIQIPLSDKTKGLSGITFVQLSDLHLGVIKNEFWLKEVVAKVNSLHPDLILVTGDLLDDKAIFDGTYSSILRQLKSKYGVFACLGNHEYYAGKDRSMDFIAKSNMKLLMNSSVIVDNKIYIIGVDDAQGKRFGAQGPDLKKALASVDVNKYLILMSHNPNYYKVASSFGIDLMLSGHTHSGQIPPIDLLVPFVYKHGYGLYVNGKGLGYTSSGTGSWGPPMRFLNSSEIVKVSFK